MKYLLAAIIVICASSSLRAGEFISVYGVSDLSCGKYLSDISDNRNAANVYDWWVAGFVTGSNLEKERILGTDNFGHSAWIKQYCEKNSLDPFMKAAIELNKELDKKKRSP